MASRSIVRVDPARVYQVQDGASGAGPVIYWMSRDQRGRDNWALLYAQEQALNRQVPLVVVFCLVTGFLNATDRAYRFMLEGLAETATQIEKKNITFVLLQGEPASEVPRFVVSCKAAELITDFDPLRVKVEWRRRVAGAVGCRFSEVDAHNIVPCLTVSPKEEFAARTIRPKIHRLLARFLVDLPKLRRHPHDVTGTFATPDWKAALKKQGLSPDAPGAIAVDAGATAGRKALRSFVSERLPTYDTARNDPTKDGQSGLSPYLHFGQLSAQRIALTVAEADAPQADIDAYLEELIIRRELSDNFCFYNPHYDTPQGFADWAKKTLAEHAGDAREYLYSYEEWDAAKTHDPLWNAAQLEMVTTGKMHGYMRMYWGKKILEWTTSPDEAMATAIRLNDTYSIDGRDPNGYAGIAWCIGGVHDRAWPSHNVYGKVRYMNANGCRRKFKADQYIEQVASM